MPISIKKIAGKVASVTFQAGETPDETLTVQYYPGLLTEKVFATLQGFGEQTDIKAGFEEFNQTLVSLIKSWDLYEDDEQTIMFPIDAARFAELPFELRMQVVDAIMRDMRPQAQTSQEKMTS